MQVAGTDGRPPGPRPAQGPARLARGTSVRTRGTTGRDREPVPARPAGDLLPARPPDEVAAPVREGAAAPRKKGGGKQGHPYAPRTPPERRGRPAGDLLPARPPDEVAAQFREGAAAPRKRRGGTQCHPYACEAPEERGGEA